MSTFAPPAEPSSWQARDAVGHLCIFEPQSYETGIKTPYKDDADAVRVLVHDIDAGETHPDALVFQGGLIAALKARIGQTVLATVGTGVPKPGQSAPFILLDATGDPAAVKRAEEFLAARAADKYAAPTPAPAATPDADAIAAAQALLASQGLA